MLVGPLPIGSASLSHGTKLFLGKSLSAADAARAPSATQPHGTALAWGPVVKGVADAESEASLDQWARYGSLFGGGVGGSQGGY
mgnify:CR=1 FL=1